MFIKINLHSLFPMKTHYINALTFDEVLVLLSQMNNNANISVSTNSIDGILDLHTLGRLEITIICVM